MSRRLSFTVAGCVCALAFATQAHAAPAKSNPIVGKTNPPPAGPFNNDPNSTIDPGIKKKPIQLPVQPTRRCGDEDELEDDELGSN